MNAITDFGEAVVSLTDAGGRDFFFRPSFAAMMELGEPEDIVAIYAELHRIHDAAKYEAMSAVSPALSDGLDRLHQRELDAALTAAMRVIEACCDDDPAPVIGQWVGTESGFYYEPGALPVTDVIVMALHFMGHGVIGRAKIRKLQRHETNERTTGFKALEYINSARVHLRMTREEAERLTMTEFQYLLAAKYPDQKGLTKEEYDKVADDFLAKQAARRAAATQ